VLIIPIEIFQINAFILHHTKATPTYERVKAAKSDGIPEFVPSNDNCNNNLPTNATPAHSGDTLLPNNSYGKNNNNRRNLLKSTFQTSATGLLAFTQTAAYAASPPKSRTDGYKVQRSEREWAYVLSGQQYNILRQGGTERPYSSILEGEDRPGVFVCAGCDTPLFDSAQKFHSGTGWPSFAASIDDNVEVENVNPVQLSLGGAELRCSTCGGHLGDVFMDGFLFVNTPAAKSGKRFCIDGAALIFKPSDGSENIFGDTPPPRQTNELPSFLSPPKITAR